LVAQKRPIKASELRGNAWAFPAIGNVRAVYETVLAKPGFISDQHDSSLDTGFFADRPVLVFLWGPSVDAELVASVHRLAILGGGSELDEDLKQEALRQIRLRWRVMKPKGTKGGTVIKHHPRGKVWTDLRD
jgi:hypothetical protein